MCVICIADKSRPSANQVKAMFEANSSGAGIAWKDKDEEGKGIIKWSKGLGIQEIQNLVATVPLPFVAHFRIPTFGGVCAELCHPFPVEPDVPLFLNGNTPGYVLFHNGSWSNWRQRCLDASITKGYNIPGEKWSDSRAMAWLASHCGIGVLEMLDEKIVAFSPDNMEIFGTGWSDRDNKGFWVSNSGWESRMSSTTYEGICRFGQCKIRKHPGSHWCWEHRDKDPNFKPLVPLTPISKDDNKGNLIHGGGTTENIPFRPHGSSVEGGPDLDKSMEKVQEKALQTAQEKEQDEKFIDTLCGDDEYAQYEWAAGINVNPKKHKNLPVVIDLKAETVV